MDFPPIVNRLYTSATYGKISITSELGDGDWINCKWTTTPKINKTEAQCELSLKIQTNLTKEVSYANLFSLVCNDEQAIS